MTQDTKPCGQVHVGTEDVICELPHGHQDLHECKTPGGKTRWVTALSESSSITTTRKCQHCIHWDSHIEKCPYFKIDPGPAPHCSRFEFRVIQDPSETSPASPPTDHKQAERVAEALRQRPDILFQVCCELRQQRVLGPWEYRDDTTMYRHHPDGTVAATVWFDGGAGWAWESKLLGKRKKGHAGSQIKCQENVDKVLAKKGWGLA